MLTLDDARRRLLDGVTPIAHEPVYLDDACGRVLAVDVVSPTDLPPHDHSAMDGWAVARDDLGARRAWCEHPDDAGSLARFADAVRARCDAVGHPAAACDAAPPVWNDPDAARAVWARAASLGHPVAPDLDRWRALTDDARYALCRLCEGRRREDRFVAALRELSL